jgi:hypothetical protein
MAWQKLNVGRLIGLLLLVAAALKFYQLATEPAPETSLFTSRWFLVAMVEFEFLLGMWLLSGVYPKQAYTVALATFAVYSLVAL